MKDLTEALDNEKDVDIMYLDFCKAFDKIPHKRLLKKIWGYGIRGKLYIWIKEFLNNMVQKVIVNGECPSTAKVTSGIPQGSVFFGPILFLIFINDLPNVIQASIKLFADDAKIYQIVISQEDIGQFQENINSAVNWSKTWQMFYNTKKV